MPPFFGVIYFESIRHSQDENDMLDANQLNGMIAMEILPGTEPKNELEISDLYIISR